MDESTYTGVDGDMASGVFHNEIMPDSVRELIDEKNKQLRDLEPKLQDLIDVIDKEKETVLLFLSEYVDNTKDSDELMRGELKAAGRYRKYLDDLKTKFVLSLKEVKK